MSVIQCDCFALDPYSGENGLIKGVQKPPQVKESHLMETGLSKKSKNESKQTNKKFDLK